MPNPEPGAIPPERPGPVFRWVELGLLVVAALVGLGFQALLPGTQASEEDYRAVAAVLKGEAVPGDVVLLAPWWTERARLFLPEGLPVVGYLHSDGDDLTEHPRIWVLAEPHLPRAGMADFEKAFLPGREADGGARPFGRLTLARYRNRRFRRDSFSAVEALARAQVYLENPRGERAACVGEGQGFRCPQGLHVAAEWHELFYEPRRCLWMHPPGGANRLVVEFTDVPGGTPLVLEAGIVWEHATQRDVTPLFVGVEDGMGQPLASLSVLPAVEGMQRVETPTSAPGPRTLRLWTRSERGDARDACVELRALAPPEFRP